MDVLVVEDSEITSIAIRQVLEQAGYVVRAAATAAAALEMIKERRPDLITLDVTLPDMDGYQLCVRLREMERARNRREIPVVFVTANDTIEGRVRGFEVGGADFVTKSENHDDIVVAVNRILCPRQQLRGTLAVVIEDSDLSRAMLRQHLEENGVTVLEARDGLEGVRLVASRAAEVDLIILDMRMPEIDGPDVCRHLRTEVGLADVPIIVVSAVEDIKSVLDVFMVGATDYIIKPYVKEELIARLNTHLHVRLLNRSLRERIEELRQLNKIKDRFLEVCSSSLDPPIRSVISSLNELARRAAKGEVDAAELRSTAAVAEGIRKMLGNLLTSK